MNDGSATSDEDGYQVLEGDNDDDGSNDGNDDNDDTDDNGNRDNNDNDEGYHVDDLLESEPESENDRVRFVHCRSLQLDMNTMIIFQGIFYFPVKF